MLRLVILFYAKFVLVLHKIAQINEKGAGYHT